MTVHKKFTSIKPHPHLIVKKAIWDGLNYKCRAFLRVPIYKFFLSIISGIF